jgi:superfamily II DNA or RNA helicase
MILRPRQQVAVSKAVKALETHGNTLVVAPTGAGKTIMLSAVAKEVNAPKTLILQHRDELIAQNMAKFRNINPNHRPSLYTADSKQWFGDAVFAMVQTLSRERNLDTMPAMDLVLVDEAHHSAADTYRRILDRILDLNNNTLIAGFTATPNRGDRKGIRSVFSNCADQITLKELIEAGHLVPPRAFAVDLGLNDELAKVRKTAMDYDMEEVSEIMNKSVINEEVVRNWKEKAGDRQTIVFASNIAHAQDVTDTFINAGIKTELVTGETPTETRKGILHRLDNRETQVVVNVAVLTEGFDCQIVGCIVLLRPCSFKSTLIQMIGRGLRTVDPELYPGVVKTDCIVMDFGISLAVHGDINTTVNLDGVETDGQGEAPTKTCPNCEAVIPAAVKFCPFCDYEFIIEAVANKEIITSAELVEMNILQSSPFQWVDLFGSGRAMTASGFTASVFVCSRDGQKWFAMGKIQGAKLRVLSVGERLQSLAAADDFLRANEDDDSAHKTRRWLKDSPSDKQIKWLLQFGYQVGPRSFNWTKYKATCHMQFQWARRAIEGVLYAA